MAKNGYHTNDHDEMQHLRERLAKVEALRDGASTPRERDAADVAASRLQDRIYEHDQKDGAAWFPFQSLEELPENLRTMILLIATNLGGELYFVGSTRQGDVTYSMSTKPIDSD